MHFRSIGISRVLFLAGAGFLAGIFVLAVLSLQSRSISEVVKPDSITMYCAVLTVTLLLAEKLMKHREVSLGEKTFQTSTIGKAMELLGSTFDTTEDGKAIKAPNVSARIGAITMLGRLAEDDLKTHALILDVVASYVTENAPLDSDNINRIDDKWSVRSDILAAIRLLGDPSLAKTRAENRLHFPNSISLKFCNLSNVDFSNLVLDGINFCNSNLAGARLWGASMRYANFYKATIGDANFGNITPERLRGALLDGADLSVAQGIVSDVLRHTYGDSETKIPAEATRPSTTSNTSGTSYWISYPAGSLSNRTGGDPICDRRLVAHDEEFKSLKTLPDVRALK